MRDSFPVTSSDPKIEKFYKMQKRKATYLLHMMNMYIPKLM